MNRVPAAHLLSGIRAEDEACRYLEQRGLRCIARNYRCAVGEIDLLLTEGHTLVFAEVRYRRNSHYGGAVESVGPRKRSRLIAAASQRDAETGRGHAQFEQPLARPPLSDR